MSGDEEEGYVVRVRGLPWSATKEEIKKFFEGIHVKDGLEGIHMTVSKEGRPSGEAYVELETEEDLTKALEKHKEHMGHRYIEVFKSKKSEKDWVMKRSGVNQQDSLNDGCVRLRGLPFGCSKEEISQFFSGPGNIKFLWLEANNSSFMKSLATIDLFSVSIQQSHIFIGFVDSGLEIVPNGISIPTDYLGRSTGEAFVQFSSREIAEKAMGKHKEKIGHRYIEIFKSSLQEIKIAFGMAGPKMRGMMPNRHCPYDRSDRFGGMGMRFGMTRTSRFYRGYDGYGEFGNGYGGYDEFNGYGPHMEDPYNCAVSNDRFHSSFNATNHCVRMRGLPFRATNVDICEFFRPINVTPVRIRLKNDRNGRPSGEADVFFVSHEEAMKAMTKDKANMRHRYIELFLNSVPVSEVGPKGFRGNRGNMTFNGGLGNHRIGERPNNHYGCMGHMDGYYCEYSGSFGNGTNTMIGGNNYSEF